MTDKITPFTGITKNDVPVEKVLDGAKAAKLRMVLVIGIDAETDELRMFSSSAEKSTIFGLCHYAQEELDRL